MRERKRERERERERGQVMEIVQRNLCRISQMCVCVSVFSDHRYEELLHYSISMITPAKSLFGVVLRSSGERLTRICLPVHQSSSCLFSFLYYAEMQTKGGEEGKIIARRGQHRDDIVLDAPSVFSPRSKGIISASHDPIDAQIRTNRSGEELGYKVSHLIARLPNKL